MDDVSLKCLFCKNTLNESTRPEHILLNALGGRKTTARAICSICNNHMGSGIDCALADQVKIIRNLLRMHSGTHKPAPTLKGVQSSNETLRIGGDGTLTIEGKPFEVEILPDGTCTVQITARSMEHANELLPDIAAEIGISEEDLRTKMGDAQAFAIEQRPGIVPLTLSFGGLDAIRSVTKSLIVLWSTLVGNEEIASPAFNAARTFVVKGDDIFLSTRTQLDSRLLPNVEEIQSRYGPLFNAMVVRSDGSGRLIGHFTLYNLIGFQVLIAEEGCTRNSSIGLVSNPLSPSIWSDRFAAEFDIPIEWLAKPVYDDTSGESKIRIEHLMRTYFEVFEPIELNRIIDDVLSKKGTRGNDTIPTENIGGILSEITNRFILYRLGLTYEQPLTADEIRAAFSGHPRDAKT